MTPDPLVTSAPRRVWHFLLLGWLVVLSGGFVWTRLPVGQLREYLRVTQFWSLEICLLLVVILVGGVLRQLTRELTRRQAWHMAVLAAMALLLTLFVAPRTNRIYYDEQIYQSIGQNLSDLRLAQLCNDGTVEYGRLQCWLGEYNKQPYAYPHLLSVFYRIFGVSETVAFAVNAGVMAATVGAIYLLVLTLFADTTAAMFAGLILLLTPQQILWSATAAVEPSASLACVVALLMAAAFSRSGSTMALAATAVATAYAVQFRPESFLIVPVIALLLGSTAHAGEIRHRRLWAVLLLMATLLVVHAGHSAAVRDESWGTTSARLSFGYVPHNIQVNGPFYLRDERFPFVFTLLAAAGLIRSTQVRERLCMALYFLLFFGMYLTFYAGSYNFGADVRYSVLTYPPIAVLAGLGAAAIARSLATVPAVRRPVEAVAAGLVLQFLWYAPQVRATTEEAWTARADVRFARQLAADLKGNAYVLTHNPGMFHIWGVNAGQMSLLINNQRYLDFLGTRYSGGVYLHWNFWCNVLDPVQKGFCEAAVQARPSELVREYRERDQRYAFYRYLVTTPLK